MRDVLTVIAWGAAIATLFVLILLFVVQLGSVYGYKTSCIPADAVEETPRAIVDAWYSVERCKDLSALHCGE